MTTTRTTAALTISQLVTLVTSGGDGQYTSDRRWWKRAQELQGATAEVIEKALEEAFETGYEARCDEDRGW